MYRYRINVATPPAPGRIPTHHFRVVFDSGCTREHAEAVARELRAAYPNGEVTLTSAREQTWRTEEY